MSSDNPVIGREQCPTCMDTGMDNLALYKDGSSHCFGCGKTAFPDRPKEVEPINEDRRLINGEIKAIPTRGITAETCRFFNYQIGKVKDQWVHVANYCDQYGKIKKQKLRTADKEMWAVGDTKFNCLYGQWLYEPNPKLFITIVEGEIDCLTVAQACGLQFPVVSIPLGTKDAKKSLSAALPWLSGFKYVILAFDNDEAGKAATEECVSLFEYGKVRICTWDKKDPNEMLVAGVQSGIRDCLFRSKSIEPANLVTVSDIMDAILEQPKFGQDYPWPTMTEITYGMRPGEIIILVGANGIGKTEMVKEIIYSQLDANNNVGLFSFEQSPESTVQRLIASSLGTKLHIPSTKVWDTDKIRSEALKLDNRIYLYKNTHSVNLEDLRKYIRFLGKVRNVKLIVIDNLKGLRKGHSDTRGYLQDCMLEFQALSRELGVTFLLLSHVAKDKFNYQAYVSTSPKNAAAYAAQTSEDVQKLVKRPGMEWESGRMPSKENVEGESAVCDLADFVFAIARNTVSDSEEERRTTKVKCLKARLDGSMTGKSFYMVYTDDGRLVESQSNSAF